VRREGGGNVGWCVGTIKARNTDARFSKTIDGQREKVNFVVYYEIDDEEVKTVPGSGAACPAGGRRVIRPADGSGGSTSTRTARSRTVRCGDADHGPH